MRSKTAVSASAASSAHVQVDGEITDHPAVGEVVGDQPLHVGPELHHPEPGGDGHGQHAEHHSTDCGRELQTDRPSHRHACTPQPHNSTRSSSPECPIPAGLRAAHGNSPHQATPEKYDECPGQWEH
jgi:hypothetical protein